MRIGIVTIHHVINYGAVWQAYALSHYLKSLGHHVEIVDYRPASAVKRYHQAFGKGRRLNIRPTLQYLGFHRFIRNQLPLSKMQFSSFEELARDGCSYDALVAGSDQIWCTGEGSFRGYDPNYFLGFCATKSVRRISYAASAGNTRTFAPHTAPIQEALLKFSSIAVRDVPSQRLVTEATGIAPALVLDPVFLHDFSEFVADVHPGNDLVIFADYPERFASMAKDLAQRHGLRIISLAKPCSTAHENRRVVSPVAWLRTIKGAKLVLTDFFHGTAVSLQFGRPLIVSAPQEKTAKILDLLQRLDLSRHFLADPNDALKLASQMLADPAAFSSLVKMRLSAHCQFSKDYLLNALNQNPPIP